MKSRVLVREEKAIGTVTMKRIMVCGMGAGVAYYTAQFLLPICSLPALIGVFVILLYATGDRYGVPRYRWLVDGWKGQFLLNAYLHPRGMIARVCAGLGWKVTVVVARGDQLYVAVNHGGHDNWTGIQILEADPDAGGLEMVDDNAVVEAGQS